MGVQHFADLLIWQRARAWSKAIYGHTRTPAFEADRRLAAQVNDSSASVMANIAEGFGRGTQGEFVQFLGYALGSLNETQSHLTAAYDRGYVPRDNYAALFGEGNDIRKMTVAFIKNMVMGGSGVKNVKTVECWPDRVWELYERVTGQPRPAQLPKARPNAERTIRRPTPIPGPSRPTTDVDK
ncbi:MAG: four helix bundle protein [Gemmataceae bacterium]|nr:four helix bundle protein [Gemmataceae bacterium]